MDKLDADIEALWLLERDFWLRDAAWADAHLDPDAVLIFAPPAGVLGRHAALDGLRAAPRWRAVQMAGKRALRIATTVALVYAARAERDDDTYGALCSSLWVDGGASGWRLALHQQTPST